MAPDALFAYIDSEDARFFFLGPIQMMTQAQVLTPTVDSGYTEPYWAELVFCQYQPEVHRTGNIPYSRKTNPDCPNAHF